MASLTDLPVEMVEDVVSFLDILDISALRLTCRTLEDKASSGRFAAHFWRKTIHLSTHTLERFVDMTSCSQLVCLLRDCTVVGGASPAHADEHRRLLAQAFRNLRQNSPSGCLSSLILRAEMYPGYYEWLNTWDAAQHTFKIAVAALDAAQLPVTGCLDVFASQDDGSLTSDVLASFVRGLAASPVFSTVTSLRLSLSAPHRDPVTGTQRPRRPPRAPRRMLFIRPASPPMTDDEDDDNDDNDDNNGNNGNNGGGRNGGDENVVQLDDFANNDNEDIRQDEDGPIRNRELQAHYATDALRNVLQLTRQLPMLAHLDVHWFNIGPFSVLPPSSPSLPSPPSLPLSLPSPPSMAMPGVDCCGGCHPLQSCRLSGLHLADVNLLHFLQATQPAALSLVYIIASEESSWAPIFAYLTDHDSPVNSFFLDDLAEKPAARFHITSTVHFENVPGTSKMPYMGGRVGPSTLAGVREHNDTIAPISYRLQPGRAMGSGATMRWSKMMRARFGPKLG